MDQVSSLAQLFFSQAALYPNQTALVIDDKTYTYAELEKNVRQLAAYLKSEAITRVGILASRSLEAYAGVLAAHWLGIAYVPINPVLPLFRIKKIIELSQINAVVLDQSSGYLQTELTQTKNIQLIEIPDLQLTSDPVIPADKDLAYIIFTSGTTGIPKGVPVSFGNLTHFIKVIKNRYPLNSTDRVSQFSALSFDVSIFDMCLAWGSGAALYIVPEKELLVPASFIQKNNLTVWLSVPSVISIMKHLNVLKPNGFATLKFSLFTGEAFTLDLAKAWQNAAPQSQVENLYGPTEATIDCLAQPLSTELHQTDLYEIMPIGKPLQGTRAAIVNDNHQFLASGEKGELAIAGDQVVSGYWQNDEITQQKFIYLKHPQSGIKKWFLTGDYCYQDKEGVFHYLYRLDNQCKILGQRIELDEIEHYLRKLLKTSNVVVMIIPAENYPRTQIIAVIDVEEVDVLLLKSQLKKYLPNYMIPEQIIYMDSLIYNVNGKLDRELLAAAIIQRLKLDKRN